MNDKKPLILAKTWVAVVVLAAAIFWAATYLWMVEATASIWVALIAYLIPGLISAWAWPTSRQSFWRWVLGVIVLTMINSEAVAMYVVVTFVVLVWLSYGDHVASGLPSWWKSVRESRSRV